MKTILKTVSLPLSRRFFLSPRTGGALGQKVLSPWSKQRQISTQLCSPGEKSSDPLDIMSVNAEAAKVVKRNNLTSEEKHATIKWILAHSKDGEISRGA